MQENTKHERPWLGCNAGDKYPCTALLSVLPSKDVSLQEAEEIAMQELNSLASEGLTDKELQRVKKVRHRQLALRL